MTLRRQLLRYLVNPVADSLLAWFMPKWRRRGSEALSALRRYINYYRPHIEADKLRENETYRKDLAEALTLWDKAETERLSALESQLAAQNPPTPSLTDRIRQSLPRVRAVLDAYPLAATAAEKNALLKSVIEKIDYQKTKRASRWTNPLDYLQITIFPRLPAGKI